MTNNELKRKQIIEVLHEVAPSKLVEIHNAVCDAINYRDDSLYSMDEIDDFYFDVPATKLIYEISGNHFDLKDAYFRFTIYGVESVEDVQDVVLFSEIADYILDEGETFGMHEIESIIESN